MRSNDLRSLRLLCPVLGLCCAQLAAQVQPAGPDFLVANVDIYEGTSVAVNPYGRFLIAWAEYFGGTGVFAFDRNGWYSGGQYLGGNPIWSERPIQVAPGFGDGFVATWESTGSGSFLPTVEAVLLDSNGATLGAQFTVTPNPVDPPCSPWVGVGPGWIVVTWADPTSDGGDDSGRSIQARYFEPDGTPYGDRFQVNTSTAGDQRYPSLAVGADGRFVVVWESQSSAGTDQSASSIQAQLFAPDACPEGNEIQVNTHTPLDQAFPDVALGADGSFVVT